MLRGFRIGGSFVILNSIQDPLIDPERHNVPERPMGFRIKSGM